MINQELIKYIEFHLQNGSSWEKIKSDLMAAGWPNNAIEENYAQIAKPKAAEENKSLLVEEIKPLELVAEEKPVQQNPADNFRESIDDTSEKLSVNEPKPIEPATSFTEWAGVKENIQAPVNEPAPINFEQTKPIAPIEATPVAQPPIERITQPQKSSKGLIIGIIFILLIALAGGGAFAYYQYIYPQQVVASAMQNILKLDSDKYFEISASLFGDFTAKESLSINNEAYNYASLTINAKTDIDASDENNIKSNFSQSADIAIKQSKSSTTSLIASERLEGLETNNTLYFKLNNFQGLESALPIFRMESMQNQIIQFVNQNVLNQWFILPLDQAGSNATPQEIIKQRQQIVSLLAANKNELSKAIQYKALGSEKIENDDCFKYQLVFNKDALKSLLVKVLGQQSESEQASFSTYFDNTVWPFLQKTNFNVWATKNNPYFRKYQIIYLGGAQNEIGFAVSSLSANFQITYKKLSAGAVTINVPQNTKSAIDLLSSYETMILKSEQDLDNDEIIKSDTNKLQAFAEQYKNQNKTYWNFTAKGDGFTLVKDMNLAGGKTAFIYIAKDKYCITKELTLNPGTYWCIDNSGYAGVSNNCTQKTYSCK